MGFVNVEIEGERDQVKSELEVGLSSQAEGSD